jgi:hypothetical protein
LENANGIWAERATGHETRSQENVVTEKRAERSQLRRKRQQTIEIRETQARRHSQERPGRGLPAFQIVNHIT